MFLENIAHGNMSRLDKSVRYGLAVLLIGQILFVSGPMHWQAYLVFFGIYLATTAITGWDLLYRLIGRKGLKPNRQINSEQGSLRTIKGNQAANEEGRRGPHKVA